ncbi:hypothetical protein T265_00344 [Opisthorchis viverrini]|uniref:Integrase catalytic domain-containing protein n=1 Tax=Opisthorchis viverrini TaxID=6198 RepID=A0A075AJS7_OPIVI|nr:hypothetical protein T265_00344 [Opisthorchis viverrini]KER33904.1 hypothetical protein T265_00344 [Opisthorchis viverrini]
MEKRYGCIFSCMGYPTIHLEVAHSLTTDSSILALMRFVGRRGRPLDIYTDNGSNFVGAVSLWGQAKINNRLLARGIQWHFNPPLASHRGGVWGRMIRSVRQIIFVLIQEQILSDDCLSTFFVEVERILNDRPLTSLTADSRDALAPTPNHPLLHKANAVDEQLRANKRAISRAVRELDAEKRRLEQDKTRIKTEIKKLAKQNEMDAVRILAKQIVRNDHYCKKFTLMRTNLEAVSLKLQTLKSTNAMGQTMKQVTQVMKRMNASMKLPQLQRIMMDFEKESGLLDSKEEMMSDAIDDALGEDDIDESEAIVNSVLAELGIEMNEQLSNLPGSGTVATGQANTPGRIAIPTPAGPAGPAGSGSMDGTIDEDDLEARLARLKRT